MLAFSLLGTALVLSIAGNVFLFIKHKKTPKTLGVDARQLLHDLTRGGSVVKLEIIDPSGLLIYRSMK